MPTSRRPSPRSPSRPGAPSRAGGRAPAPPAGRGASEGPRTGAPRGAFDAAPPARKRAAPTIRSLHKKKSTARPARRADGAPPALLLDDAGAPVLSGKANRHLRGLGHALDPVVHVGKEGVTDGVVRTTREQLRAHELVKVKILPECPEERRDAAADLAARAEAALVQVLGRTALLYRPHPSKPRLALPR